MEESQVATGPAPERVRASRIFGQYIVKKRFQFKFAAMVFSFLAIAAFVIWIEGDVAVQNMVDSGMVSSPEAVAQLKLLNGIIARTAVVALALTFAVSLVFSHFIAGPIYRFERTLEEMRSGNLGLTVQLRRHDEFKEVADLFNQAITSLRNKVEKEREVTQAALARAAVLAEKLEQEGRTNEAHELRQLIIDVKNFPAQIRY